MNDEKIQIYCGTGCGRSAAATGLGIRYAAGGKQVCIVRFLKGKSGPEAEYLKKLEPEIKLFCFDKFEACYSSLTPKEQEEEKIHIKTGLAYAKKELVAEDCDVLILDEVLDLPDMGIVDESEIISVIESAGDDTVLILTGTHKCEKLWEYATRVTEVSTLKG